VLARKGSPSGAIFANRIPASFRASATVATAASVSPSSSNVRGQGPPSSEAAREAAGEAAPVRLRLRYEHDQLVAGQGDADLGALRPSWRVGAAWRISAQGLLQRERDAAGQTATMEGLELAMLASW
jgi:hypothetical protein